MDKRRIDISFYDTLTGEFVGGLNSPLRKIDLLRCKHSKYIKLYKSMMTNTLRRAGVLIGSIRTKIKILPNG